MPYLETDFTSEMSPLIKKRGAEFNLDHSFLVEYKTKKAGKRLNFKSDFQAQQIPYLLQAQDACVYMKLSDIDPSLKPADAIQVCNVPSYLIVCWYSPRKYKNVYIISAKTLNAFIKKGNKSMTEEDALALSINSFDLMNMDKKKPRKPKGY